MNTASKNPYGKYNGNEAEYLLRFLDSEADATAWVPDFEAKFAEKLGVKYAVAVNSGTSGLHAALFAAGVGPGDEVITPAMTVVMDSYAVLALGAEPVFADIDLATHHMDAADVARKITSRTKAIVTVSWHGMPVDMDPIMDIAKRHNLIVVDDSCQTMLGRYKGQIAGTNAHLGVFSFEEKKHMTTGSEGGMIVSNDEALATRARKFAGIGYKHITASAGRTHLAISTVQDPAYERFDLVGLNYRMSRVQAVLGTAQLERIEHLVARRQAVARFFREAVAGCTWMIEQAIPYKAEHTFYTFAVDYRGESERGVRWKEFYNRYAEMGGDGFYGCNVLPYLEPALKGRTLANMKLERGLCPKAEALQLRTMCFKTNYRDMGDAKRKAELLARLIDEIGR